MTYCELLTSRKVSEDTEMLLNRDVASVVHRVLGEGEDAVVLSILDRQDMAFEDSDEPCAEIRLKGAAAISEAQCDALKKAFYPVLAKFLNLSQDKIRFDYQRI